MKITFAGGADSIGASCALLECGNSSLIIDCGIRMGEGKSPLPDLSILNDAAPEAIMVTHAHTDHSGALPLLAASFPRVPILTTPPSIDLISILLNDSLKLMNSPEREADIPLFTKEQVEKTAANFMPLHQGEIRMVGPFGCTFYPAGHILGASMLHVATPDGYVLFTGDYSAGGQRTVGSVLKPQLPVDLLISEATYGNRLHEERKAAETRFITQVREVVDRGGRVLIPCFAVGRAQEILLILRTAMRNGQLTKTPVFVDGMVRLVCNVYANHERYVTRSLAHDIHHQPHPFFTDTIAAVRTPQERTAALGVHPAIYVASSGMLSGGASVVYARELLKNGNDAILLTGYQDEESPGRRLLALAEKTDGKRTIVLQGETVGVAATVSLFGLSAHADRLQMAALIESCKPRSVVLVHGDKQARDALRDALQCSDTLCVNDGQTIERTYPLRRSAAVIERLPLPNDGDIPRIRALLGPPSQMAVRASAVALSWFGEKVSGDVVEKFVQQLIDLDLVRRHDDKRTLVHVLHPAQSEVLSDEANSIEQLKNENPKGKLLEHCMRIRTPFPVTEFGIDGAYHTARMCLEIEGTLFDSGIRHSSDKTAAEQMAARELLSMCEKSATDDIDGVIVTVEESREAPLKAGNPKGKLLEWRTKAGGVTPEFQSRVIAGWWCTKVTVEAGGTVYRSDWNRHRNRKIAEHGAAAQVLELLDNADVAAAASRGAVNEELHDLILTASPHDTTADPLVTLNYLRQHTYLTDYGFTDRGGSGPAHAPVFECSGWVALSTNERIESPVCSGTSKKNARRNAAAVLVGMIGEVV